jgi:hypothetical protein
MDPKLYAISVLAEQLSRSTQPLVPQHVFIAGGANGDDSGGLGLVGTLVNLLVAERSGFDLRQANSDAKEANGDANIELRAEPVNS